MPFRRASIARANIAETLSQHAGLPDEQLQRITDRFLLITMDTVARGFRTAADVLDCPAERERTAADPGNPAARLREWGDEIRSEITQIAGDLK